MGLQISMRKSSEVTILDLRGRSTIDYGGSDLLYRYLQGLVDDGVRNLLLNVEELTQVDSSAISVIVETYVSVKRKGGYLKLLRPCGRVLAVLRLFQLHVIPSFDDEAMALASFQPQGYAAKP